MGKWEFRNTINWRQVVIILCHLVDNSGKLLENREETFAAQ